MSKVLTCMEDFTVYKQEALTSASPSHLVFMGWSQVGKLLHAARWVGYCSRRQDFGGLQSCLQIPSLLPTLQPELSYFSLDLCFPGWRMEMVPISWDC